MICISSEQSCCLTRNVIKLTSDTLKMLWRILRSESGYQFVSQLQIKLTDVYLSSEIDEQDLLDILNT